MEGPPIRKSNPFSSLLHILMRFTSIREFIYKYFLFRPPKNTGIYINIFNISYIYYVSLH